MNEDRTTILWISDAQVEALRPRFETFKATIRQGESDYGWVCACTGWLMGAMDALGIDDEQARRDAMRRIRGVAANDPRWPKS